jgi:uncharacterized membrane-anchored protein
MIATTRKWLLAGLAVAGLQTAAIVWMVRDRIQLLQHGREIVLPIVPVDPRSLFRGDYVILSYDISNVNGSLVAKEVADAKPQQFFVTLTKSGDAWTPTGLTLNPLPATADRISVKARPQFGWNLSPRARPAPAGTTPARLPEPQLRVRYGIESYFVQEGTGPQLEDTARQRKLAAVVAVDAKGNAAIKALMIDGKRQYEEPLL